MLLDTDDILNKALEDSPLTEDALALRFSERHTDSLRYVAEKDQWYRWDGNRWSEENTLLVFDLVRTSAREDIASYSNGKPDKAVSSKLVGAVTWLARTDRRQAATVEQFDADPWLLTVDGATVDLQCGKAYDPDPSDFITKKAGCSIVDPGTEHPMWTAFLNRIFADNQELIAFLQRFLGYGLTGLTREHVFVFAYGTGRNGKSTLMNTVAGILGDYACVADAGTFLASGHERHPTDVAKLHGARFVVAQETERGRRWDETKIKSLTGGDRLTARFMRCDFFDFVPTHKLAISGNNKPRLDNVDEAMRARLLMIPFLVQIPKEERDPELAEKLKAEWPAILRWMVDGCLAWQKIGLAPPKIVTDATSEYFDDQDVVGQWLSECTRAAQPTAFIRMTELFPSWKAWCDERHLDAGGSNTLSETLSSRNYQHKRRKRGSGFLGLRLATEDDLRQEQQQEQEESRAAGDDFLDP
jgi:putative DNA primase/helicase